MGILREKVKIANPLDGAHFLEIEMVVDSGATYTQVPVSLLSQLKIDKKFKRRLKIATGEVIERDAGEIRISIKNETLTTMVIFGDERSEPLLGAVTLEQFGLAIDPVNKTLIPVPELMLLTIKPKHSN
jgi:clan AA aspartic protease